MDAQNIAQNSVLNCPVSISVTLVWQRVWLGVWGSMTTSWYTVHSFWTQQTDIFKTPECAQNQ